ncbi:protein F37C4.5-like isoform X2 [Ptychodera flava]|uniref:protein F37C4.5-like isoform X2 n=1 Tax=Ptychodera flava TaxID=63121 RepID=UPI00396A17EC
MESEGAEHSNMKIFEAPDCPVVSVVVYQQDRAEVCRSVVTKLEKGENEVVLRKLSHSIDKDSIRVEGKGPAVINEVTFSSKYVVSQESQDDVRLKELKDRLTECQKDKKVLCTKKHRLQKQRVVLDGFADNLMKPSTVTDKEGTQACLTRVLDRDLLEGMTGFFDLYDGQAARLDADLHQLSMDMERVDEELAVITRNLHKQNAAKDGFQSREVSIMLETREECEVELLISYVVTNAKWTPKYDIRVFSQDKMMKIMYYGMIQQSTGEDWIDTKLSLSTAMPSVGGSPPPLGTQMLTFKPKVLKALTGMVTRVGSRSKSATKTVARTARKPIRKFSFRKKKQESKEDKDEKEKSREDLDAEEKGKSTDTLDAKDEGASPPPSSPDDAEPELEQEFDDVHEVRESVTSTAYEITRHSTIPSDNLGHKVSVAIVDLDPVFEHDTVPKRVPHAFVKAIAKNTSQYALLPGPANVFFDNNFVAKTVMRSVSPSEEFDCSLGVDPSVRVIYKPIHKYREQSGIISKTTTTTYRQVIEIKNTRQDAVKITVHEQLPLSSEEKIKVTLQEPSIKDKNDKSKPVRMNKNNNIEWYLEIPSCSSHELVLKYSVEHPSSEDIEVTETAAAQA